MPCQDIAVALSVAPAPNANTGYAAVNKSGQ